MSDEYKVSVIDPRVFFKLLNAAIDASHGAYNDIEVLHLVTQLGERYDPDEAPIIITQGTPAFVADGEPSLPGVRPSPTPSGGSPEASSGSYGRPTGRIGRAFDRRRAPDSGPR